MRNKEQCQPILSKNNFKCNYTTVSPDLIQDLATENTSVVDFNRPIEENFVIDILGKVLEHILKDSYGDIWEKIVIIKPPWSAIDILKCIEKHWIAIFIDKFSNEFKTFVLQLLNILSVDVQSAERTKLCNKKISFLTKLIDKSPYKKILKANKNINCELSNISQSKIASYHHSVGEKEVVNTNSSSNSFLDNNNYNEDYTSYSASSSHKDVSDKMCFTLNADEDFNPSLIRNSIIKLGEHATFLMQSLIASVINEYEVNRFQADSDVTSSLHSLRQTLVAFGYSMKSYTDEFSSILGKISLSDQISNYWKLAQVEAPNISFSDENIHTLAHTNEGREFFMCCISDLEKIIQTIDTVLAKPTPND